MCGLLFIASNDSAKYIDNLIHIDQELINRGPDSRSIYQRGRYIFSHYLLSITGNHAAQPQVDGDRVTLFNGEIYNYREFNTNHEINAFSDMSLDIDSMLDRLNYINGEYASIIFCAASKKVVAITDTFGTKPLWIGYSTNSSDWAICSYPSILAKLGFNKSAQFKSSTVVILDASTGHVLSSHAHSPFDLKQYKQNYDEWFQVFEESIMLRLNTNHASVVPLSSGYDSGCIAAAAVRKGLKTQFVTITAEENTEILKARSNYLSANHTFLEPTFAELKYYSEALKTGAPDFNYRKFMPNANLFMSQDPGAIGLSMICRYSKESFDAKVLLSGQGADEIFCDYGFNKKKLSSNSHIAGFFPQNLNSIFPWPNFYGGVNRCYLSKDEYVSGLNSMEGRYPFLDKKVVQEFLWLTSSLKNRRYKAPLAEYLDATGFPYVENEKKGFNAYAGVTA